MLFLAARVALLLAIDASHALMLMAMTKAMVNTTMIIMIVTPMLIVMMMMVTIIMTRVLTLTVVA